MIPRTQIISGTETALPGARPAPRPLAGGWPRGWRAAAGLVSVAAGAVVIAGAFLPWVEVFAGLVQVPGVPGTNGQILVAVGAVIAAAGLYQLTRGGERAHPAMFTKAFPAMMLTPAGMGEPAFVSGPVLTASRLISGHMVPVNAMFPPSQPPVTMDEARSHRMTCESPRPPSHEPQLPGTPRLPLPDVTIAASSWVVRNSSRPCARSRPQKR